MVDDGAKSMTQHVPVLPVLHDPPSDAYSQSEGWHHAPVRMRGAGLRNALEYAALNYLRGDTDREVVLLEFVKQNSSALNDVDPTVQADRSRVMSSAKPWVPGTSV